MTMDPTGSSNSDWVTLHIRRPPPATRTSPLT